MNAIRIVLFLLSCASLAVGGNLDIVFDLSEANQLTAEQRAVFEPALSRAEVFWESVILGRTGQDEPLIYPIQVRTTNSGLAAATVESISRSGDFAVSTAGTLWVNSSQIISATDGLGIAPGVDILDELLAHEVAHALGMGLLWNANDLVESGTGKYTGAHGLAAFRDEFESMAEFVPVELAGGSASSNVHWDQLFRSSPQEGNPADPLSLSPLIGVTDHRGRDLGQDIMSAAIDPDFGEPYISNTTVQAFRDIGFDVVASFPTTVCDFDENGLCDAADIDALTARIRDGNFAERFDLHTDGVMDALDQSLLVEWYMDRLVGDADLDDRVDFHDFLVLSSNFGHSGGWANGDFDGSGTIEFSDFLALSDSFGTSTQVVAVVPEPAGVNAAWIAGALLLAASEFRKRPRL